MTGGFAKASAGNFQRKNTVGQPCETGVSQVHAEQKSAVFGAPGFAQALGAACRQTDIGRSQTVESIHECLSGNGLPLFGSLGPTSLDRAATISAGSVNRVFAALLAVLPRQTEGAHISNSKSRRTRMTSDLARILLPHRLFRPTD
jgi:hypothetical protein